MNRKISETLRQQIIRRAGQRCEYCRLPAIDSFYGFHIDHIISRKHGGTTILENLAFACPDCNRNKGTDLGTVLDDSSIIIRFFNPRKDNWFEHFTPHTDGFIASKTSFGEATLKVFQINHPDRIIERGLLQQLELFP